MSASLARHARAQLAEIAGQGRIRRRRVIDSGHGVAVTVDGVSAVNFCNNDYLGLAAHADVAEALAEAARRLGSGSAASQMVTGHNAEHAALETELAAWVGRERALVFSTGYAVNLGTIEALVGRGDHVIADARNHASLIDGARLSGASKHIYAHGDAEAAAARLAGAVDGHRLLVTDSIFSMDGDTAPLAALAGAAATHDGWLMVDDAHGLGVFGPGGAGRVAEAGLGADRVPILTATLGKAAGVAGAFVAGDHDVIELLLQRTRSLIFSTAMPPAVAAAARTGVAIARQDETRRRHLHALIARFRANLRAGDLPLAASDSPIQPVIVGAEDDALALSEALADRGFLVGAIRPPTVAPGTSRLRITLTAAHTVDQVDALCQALCAAWQACGIADTRVAS
ncbi:8-amino-7-oxononanoate synthase [Salinisphaera sp. Q1T1-3]|uniref:8-amino-7-oxononanoate synthase n=1 Tax=Salinisphaera sp. Q1T1-3 TaxID=2321229 RepID=UPI000E71F745|nr:8-amino-7-oxononanoate synthase [Salinisphaera sp. Q1T1-3]RJS94329.1 8-amino-7-oxononanoate synthase [Salinisphaera sp. Q1T1-3]